MTDPALMNCEHCESGWCAGCVEGGFIINRTAQKALEAERDQALNARNAANELCTIMKEDRDVARAALKNAVAERDAAVVARAESAIRHDAIRAMLEKAERERDEALKRIEALESAAEWENLRTGPDND